MAQVEAFAAEGARTAKNQALQWLTKHGHQPKAAAAEPAQAAPAVVSSLPKGSAAQGAAR